MADAAMTTMSAVATPVTGPRSVILVQVTPVARPVAPEVRSRTLVTMVSGTSWTWPVRSACRSGISADGRATTGQPKLAQKPQLLQACWPLWPLTELAAIGNGNGCRPSVFRSGGDRQRRAHLRAGRHRVLGFPGRVFLHDGPVWRVDVALDADELLDLVVEGRELVRSRTASRPRRRRGTGRARSSAGSRCPRTAGPWRPSARCRRRRPAAARRRCRCTGRGRPRSAARCAGRPRGRARRGSGRSWPGCRCRMRCRSGLVRPRLEKWLGPFSNIVTCQPA